MTRIIFQAGLNWKIMNAKWPAFYEAFAGFDVYKVASFTEADVQRLMSNAEIIRNAAKIQATIRNAEIFQEIATELGSFRRYLDQLLETEGLEKTQKMLQKRFSRLGKSSARMFLWSIGVEVPHPD